MGAALDDDPDYFRRGAIFAALAVLAFFSLAWLENAGIKGVDDSRIAQVLFSVRAPTFAAALFLLLSVVSMIRGLMGVVIYLNSCLMVGALAFLVVATIAGIALFFEYRPDFAAERVAERKASPESRGKVETPEKTSDQPEMRTFTAADGRTMKAALISFDGKKVKIRRADGKIFSNRIELYSAEDWEFISSQQRSHQ